MPVLPPTLQIVSAFERWQPGFWTLWIRSFRAGASSAGGIKASSWWRSAPDNAAVGGARESQHLVGLAVDVEAADPARAAASFSRAGFTVVDEGSHLHLQTFQPGALARHGVFSALGIET